MKNIPINLEFSTKHNLPDNYVDDIKESEMKAVELAFASGNLFVVISEICDHAAHSGKFNTASKEEMFHALACLAELGKSVTTSCYKEIDRLKHFADANSCVFDESEVK